MNKDPINPRCSLLLLDATHFGKFQILNYFKDESHGCLLTLGIQLRAKDFMIEDKNLILQLWNTSTIEYQNSIFRSLFKIVPGILITHNVASINSWNKLRNYSKLISEYCRLDAQVFIVLMGLTTDKSDEQLQLIGKQLKFMHLYYIQSQQKIEEQIQKILNNIAEKLIEKGQIKSSSQQMAYIINQSKIQEQQQADNKNIKISQSSRQGQKNKQKCY